MKKAKRNAVITIVIFLILLAAGVYVTVAGVGAKNAGSAKNITLGLDLQGGVSITYDIVDENPTSDEISATLDKLQRRVDSYSPDGEVYMEGNTRFTVELPVDTSRVDANEILEEMGQPGKLEFLDEDNYALWSAGSEYEPVLTGSDVRNAEAQITQNTATGANDNVVILTFTEEGQAKFAEATAANIGKIIYILYDDEVVSYPTVQSAITEGNAEINGISSYEDAQNLADTIKIGALPLELSEVSSQIVGAKLGQEAVSTSLLAGLIGMIIVCIIMIVAYRIPGIIATFALFGYIVLELLLLNAFNITLTLPGIAGIILSIGMAVDANVIIYTRIKEEITAGQSVKTAVKLGFSKALSAILDGNITTIIAGVVLLLMGSGPVKGFARTLILGIVLSMFTAVVVTRFLLNAVVALGVNKPRYFGTIKRTAKFNYVGKFKYFVSLSIVLILLGIAFLPVNSRIREHSLNYSLEFLGGTSVTVDFDRAYTLEESEQEIVPVIEESTGISAANIQIQTVEDSNQVIFKMPELSQEQRESLDNALNEAFTVSDINTQSISSTISSEMQRDAIIAVIVSAILMLIYIAFRFADFKFGASAVIALLHDVMIVFMVYSVGYLSVGSTFIACMLTIVGYSINATIIIFDRIRENLKIMNPEKTGYAEIVNISINQTLTRNIFTTLTTFIMVLVLFIMGVASIKEFSLTLMVGILGGAYSSVFITGPLWYFMKTRIGKKGKKADL